MGGGGSLRLSGQFQVIHKTFSVCRSLLPGNTWTSFNATLVLMRTPGSDLHTKISSTEVSLSPLPSPPPAFLLRQLSVSNFQKGGAEKNECLGGLIKDLKSSCHRYLPTGFTMFLVFTFVTERHSRKQ